MTSAPRTRDGAGWTGVASSEPGRIATGAGALVEEMVHGAGIEVGTEMIVNDPSLWSEWASGSVLAIGETYMQGKWDAPRLDQVMAKLASMPAADKRKIFSSWRAKALLALNAAFNPQRRSRERKVIDEHYELGTDFFRSWLDENMQYTCGFWKDATTLDEAQLSKMRLIGEKLNLRPGMRVLDIGCGWGGLGRFLIREYGVDVTGVTISETQAQFCRDAAVAENMKESFEVVEKSYRDVSGKWDRITVVGMLEHVGPKNYSHFFDRCYRSLTDNGLMLLHVIGSNMSQEILRDEWTTKYIFANGTLPSIAQIAKTVEKKLVIEDLQNCGPDYDRTLMAWYDNFQKVKGDLDLHPTFIRMWEFFLLYSAAGFRERKTQLWQFVMSKRLKSRYDAPR